MSRIIGDFQDNETAARIAFPKYFNFFEEATKHIAQISNAEFSSLYVTKDGAGNKEFEIIYIFVDHPNGWQQHQKDLNSKFPGAYPLESASISFSGSESNSGQWNIEAFELCID